jgi:glycine dehydrogenase subunit 1
VVSVDPLSLGIVKSPGDYGADIVFGEGKGLGNPLDFGGSTLGFFACKREFLRQLPGRIIGMTKDKEGRRAFCMTMQTREQHIRRGKATSNICTNEGLCALSALVYLSWLGEKGLYELGKINFERGKELFEGIISIRGFERVFTGIHFNEFVVRCKNAHKESKKLLSKGIQGGLILDYLYPELKNCMLFGVTELHSSRDIEKLLSILKEI